MEEGDSGKLQSTGAYTVSRLNAAAISAWV
jgi:hypothetical protein